MCKFFIQFWVECMNLCMDPENEKDHWFFAQIALKKISKFVCSKMDSLHMCWKIEALMHKLLKFACAILRRHSTQSCHIWNPWKQDRWQISTFSGCCHRNTSWQECVIQCPTKNVTRPTLLICFLNVSPLTCEGVESHHQVVFPSCLSSVGTSHCSLSFSYRFNVFWNLWHLYLCPSSFISKSIMRSNHCFPLRENASLELIW